MEWIFFAVAVAVIGFIGIAVGLALGRAIDERRAARGEGVESDSFMTPVGPPVAEDEEAVAAEAGDVTDSNSAATVDALEGGQHD